MLTAPCPICHYPDGFHDTADDWTEQRCAQVRDRSKVRPGNKALRRARRVAA